MSFPRCSGTRAGEAERGFLRDLLSFIISSVFRAAGCCRLLAHCQQRGCYVAVVQPTRSVKISGPSLPISAGSAGFRGQWVRGIVSATKPAPDPIFKALDGTGIAPDETVWMVGDTPAEPQMCLRGGLYACFWWVGRKYCRAVCLDPSAALESRNCNDLVHCFELIVPYI